MSLLITSSTVPIIFLRDKFDLDNFQQIREVIDGQQRLRTILAYVGGKKLLPDYNAETDDFTVQSPHQKELVGKLFNELTKQQQTQILEYEFSVHVLPSSVEDTGVLQIFRRMNSTSNYHLEAQELRNSSYFGEFKTSVYQLAAERLINWREWAVFTEQEIARMQEVELTSRICAIMLNPEQIRSFVSVDSDYLDKVYHEFDNYYPKRREIERRFRTVMDTIDKKFDLETIQLILGESKDSFYIFFFFLYELLFGFGYPMDNASENKTAREIANEKAEKALEEINHFKNRLNDDQVLQTLDKIKQSISGDIASGIRLLQSTIELRNGYLTDDALENEKTSDKIKQNISNDITNGVDLLRGEIELGNTNN